MSDMQQEHRQHRATIEQAIARMNAQGLRRKRDALRSFSFLWQIGSLAALVRLERGVFAAPTFQPGIEASWDFTLAAPSEVWDAFLAAKPSAPYHHLFGMWAREPAFRLDGSRETMMRHATMVNALMLCARAVRNGGQVSIAAAAEVDGSSTPSCEAIKGSYWRVPVGGVPHRFYVEQAGSGRDLLFLHTAGSDSRQYCHLMNDAKLAEGWRMTAFDLAGHGKSFLPSVRRDSEYLLNEEDYIAQVIAVCDALRLERPVVVGCSMAGSLCLRLAQRFPERFGGVIACEAAERVPARLNHWLVHPNLDGAEFAPQWIDGLMAPDTPAQYRDEILWCYSQAAADVFHGDVAFYSGSFNMSEAELAGMDTARCPVFMLTGTYDYSCTPEMSRCTAEKIPGARFVEMTDLGHFPIAENPQAFSAYLMPILSELQGRG